MLKSLGKIWLPYMKPVMDKLNDFRDILEQSFVIDVCTNLLENPLYLATDHMDVYNDLIDCPGPHAVVNETQRRFLVDDIGIPSFIVLTCIINKHPLIKRYNGNNLSNNE